MSKQNSPKCPQCHSALVKYEKDGRIWYDCPRCGFCFCDDSDYHSEVEDDA